MSDAIYIWAGLMAIFTIPAIIVLILAMENKR